MRPLRPQPPVPDPGDADPLTVEATVRASLYDGPRKAPPGRPWVLANMVAGLDGSLTTAGRVGALSSAIDRRLFVHLRGLADAVVVGAGTVRAEGYGPVRLPQAVQSARRAAGRDAVPPLVVVSRSLDLDPAAALFGGPTRTVVLTSASSPPERRAALGDVADVVVAGVEAVDVAAGLATLSQRGHQVVLTEGGPTLLADLVDHGVLDELCLTLAPVLGGDPVTMAVPSVGLRPLTRWNLASAAEADGELFLRYLAAEAVPDPVAPTSGDTAAPA